jgi:hypothetical protein
MKEGRKVMKEVDEGRKIMKRGKKTMKERR